MHSSKDSPASNTWILREPFCLIRDGGEEHMVVILFSWEIQVTSSKGDGRGQKEMEKVHGEVCWGWIQARLCECVATNTRK